MSRAFWSPAFANPVIARNRKDFAEAWHEGDKPKELRFELDIFPNERHHYNWAWNLRVNGKTMMAGNNDSLLKAKIDGRLAKRKFLRHLKSLSRARRVQATPPRHIGTRKKK